MKATCFFTFFFLSIVAFDVQAQVSDVIGNGTDPIHYDEQDGGDLDFNFNPNNPNFMFGVGDNVIEGAQKYYDSENIDFDSFLFFVPEGTSLTGVKVEYFNLETVAGTPLLDSAYRIYPHSTGPNGSDFCWTDYFSLLESPKTFFVNACDFPYAPSTLDFPFPSVPDGYEWRQGLSRQKDEGGGKWSYRLTFVVELDSDTQTLLEQFDQCSAALGCAFVITAEFPPYEIANAAQGICSAEEAWREGSYVESIAKVTLVVVDVINASGFSVGGAVSCIEFLMEEYYDVVVESGKNWIEEKEKLIQQLLVYRPNLPNLSSIWNIFVFSPVSVTLTDDLGNIVRISGDGQEITNHDGIAAIPIFYGDHNKLIIFAAEEGREYRLAIEGDGADIGDQYTLNMVRFDQDEKDVVKFAPSFTHQGSIDLVDLSVPINELQIQIDMNDDGEYESSQLPSEILAVPADHQINVGHSGAWFNPDTSGQGQFIDIEPESKFMFVGWFTYSNAQSDNPNEQHWYTAQGNYSGNEANLDLYETLGGAFDDPKSIQTTKVGQVTLDFVDCGHGILSYKFDNEDRQNSFSIERAIPGSENLCENRTESTTQAVDINAGMDGSWYDPNTPGQGFLFDVYTNTEGTNFVFASWYTYGADTASGQKWLTAQGNIEGSQGEIDIYETTGGGFDDPKSVHTVKAGTLTIDFEGCKTAKLNYSLTSDGAEGQINVERAIPGGEALCEELAGND